MVILEPKEKLFFSQELTTLTLLNLKKNLRYALRDLVISVAFYCMGV